MNEEQARRVGVNEALFREVNEEIQAINRTFGDSETISVLCECGRSTCAEQIEINVADYRRIRHDPRQFIVVSGHDLPEFETVVERGDGYEVVRKNPGVPTEVAEGRDPHA